jgi:hypothetical protein
LLLARLKTEKRLVFCSPFSTVVSRLEHEIGDRGAG